MANSIITTAGLALFADAAATGKTIAIDKMIFADVPGLDVSQTPDPAQGLPAGIVCRTEIDRSAKIDDRTVVYSKTLAATVGDFYINWIGLYSTSESTLVAVCCVPRHKKYATSEFEAGNTLYKNFALSFANAAALTGITIAPEAWQMQGEYALKEHTHTIPQVTGLQAALDGKENAGAVAAHNSAEAPHPGKFEVAGAVAAHNSAEAPHPGKFEVAGAVTKHNASGVAHGELFRAKISKPTTGSAGQYLKLESDGSCSWANVAGVPIGTIFPYVCKRPPNGAYLLNGQTITNCSTLYPQFWEWINAEVSAGYIRAVADNATFDAELSAKGNCGAFVLNAGGVTGAVRLPLIADGFIMGALSDQQGYTMAAGLPNIQGSFGAKQFTAYGEGWGEGAFYAENPSGDSAGGGSSGKTTVFYLDASRSSSVYGNSTTVQPPAVRFPYCIQVYHATSPLSEQQAAQLASEMQIRADTSLSNLTDNGIRAVRGVFSAQPSGYAWLPSGMIIQWGETAAQSAEVSADVIFPATFPNACLTVVVGTKIEESVTVPSGCDFTVQLLSKTLTGATFFWQGNSGGTQKAKATWVAIGY